MSNIASSLTERIYKCFAQIRISIPSRSLHVHEHDVSRVVRAEELSHATEEAVVGADQLMRGVQLHRDARVGVVPQGYRGLKGSQLKE